MSESVSGSRVPSTSCPSSFVASSSFTAGFELVLHGMTWVPLDISGSALLSTSHSSSVGLSCSVKVGFAIVFLSGWIYVSEGFPGWLLGSLCSSTGTFSFTAGFVLVLEIT